MARFNMELPDEIIKDFRRIYENSDEIFGKMTQAGADVVYNNMLSLAPQSIRESEMIHNLQKTDVYKTPSDGGINTKVAFYGYFKTKDGRTMPAPLVANVFEYGRSNLPFPKHPFMRKAFRKDQIEKAMLKAQKEASGGLLE